MLLDGWMPRNRCKWNFYDEDVCMYIRAVRVRVRVCMPKIYVRTYDRILKATVSSTSTFIPGGLFSVSVSIYIHVYT